MTDFLKKNKVHIYLLTVIAGLASLPLAKTSVLADAGLSYKLILVLVNLTTAVISFSCFRIMFGGATVGTMGSMLYTWCPLRCSSLYIMGSLEESVAWIFVPIVLLGLIRLYEDSGEGKEKKRVWMTLALGFALLAVSSLTFFCVTAGAAFIWFLLMGRKSFRKENLICVGKAVLATGFLGGWFLVPRLMDMRNPELVGSLIPENFRMSGCYPTQYLSLFSEWGVGAAVLLLVFVFLWSLFVKKFEDSFAIKVLIFVGILCFMGSNLFPWDLLQNKNMLFSVVLAILRTPVRWVVLAYAGMIWIGCNQLQKLSESGETRVYQGVLILTALISFGMNQLFVLGL